MKAVCRTTPADNRATEPCESLRTVTRDQDLQDARNGINDGHFGGPWASDIERMIEVKLNIFAETLRRELAGRGK